MSKYESPVSTLVWGNLRLLLDPSPSTVAKLNLESAQA